MTLDVEKTLSQLKDFQRNTVEYVFRRMYLDEKPALRFLIADEVGLGKTMVAKGIIARAVEHMLQEGKVGRIDVVYVCSNAAIAAQNLNRLNVTGEKERIFATRLTLLPSTLRDLQKQKINFVSFTPGTTFDLGRRGGIVEERAVLYALLKASGIALNMAGLSNVLQGQAGDARWGHERDWQRHLDPGMQTGFAEAVCQNRGLSALLVATCAEFAEGPHCGVALSDRRYELIGRLRHTLAKVCVEALEPDLIILDEFQRFKDLLHGEDEAAQLARALWDYNGPDGPARTLLLSATPYRMMTLDHEADDDHYPDFLKTIRFLMGNDDDVAALKADLDRFRRALYGLSAANEAEALAARDAIERRLKSVMVRTERVGSTVKLDAMVSEPPVATRLDVRDLHEARMLAKVSEAVGAGDVVEYWKSSPYLLQFMRDYQLKRQFRAALALPRPDLVAALAHPDAPSISERQVAEWQDMAPGNSRLRALAEATLDRGMWQMLWLPPSLPYLQPAGAYAVAGEVSKSLVFSSWNVVPDAIAAVLSYEAERRMLERETDSPAYADLHDKRKPLLRFQVTGGRRSGMAALALLYPSAALVEAADPLRLALAHGNGEPLTVAQARSITAASLHELLFLHGLGPVQHDGRVDERWYWAAPAMLDAARFPAMRAWLTGGQWRPADGDDADDAGKGFVDHVAQLTLAFDGKLDPALGRAPDDLFEVLADLALAGPGVCASRALGRVAPGLALAGPDRLNASGTIAAGLRTLFNLPETMALLRGTSDDSYWLIALRHGLGGNLQAMLDEYVHGLLESLGVQGHPQGEAVGKIAKAAAEALSLRTSRLNASTYDARPDDGTIAEGSIALRTRFALRFGEIRDDQGAQLARADTVRQAFNSPFRPFVLASTSVGQEGLDFHTYCHVLWHWNLPSNPVDLEQREGRVHRYKGHAVRKNVARQYGLRALQGRTASDPWAELFALARADRQPGLTDLVPYWIFETEGGARVERRVPMPPLSREHGQLARLKRALAVYRLVFGQPRQQDLMAHLEQRLQSGEAVDFSKWRISLVAPVTAAHVRPERAVADSDRQATDEASRRAAEPAPPQTPFNMEEILNKFGMAMPNRPVAPLQPSPVPPRWATVLLADVQARFPPGIRFDAVGGRAHAEVVRWTETHLEIRADNGHLPIALPLLNLAHVVQRIEDLEAEPRGLEDNVAGLFTKLRGEGLKVGMDVANNVWHLGLAQAWLRNLNSERDGR